MPESLNAFLDTTVFDGELYDFGSRRFETLRKLIRDQLARIVITDVTKREVEAHIREHVAEALRAVRAVMKERFNRVLNHFGEHFRVFQDRHDAGALAAEHIGRFDTFLRDFGIEVISTDRVEVGPILTKYFSNTPPFSEGRKKNEFPDAIAAAALERWIQGNGRALRIVSNDEDWVKICGTVDRFSSHRTLTDFLAVFPDQEIVEQLAAALVDDPVLKQQLIDDFETIGFSPNEDGEIEDVFDVDVQITKIIVMGYDQGICTLEVTCRFDYKANVSYDIPGTGIWDSEEHEVFMPDRGHGVAEDWVELVAEVELIADEQTHDVVEVSNITFDSTDVEVDISPLIPNY